jgi:hypothetical protein
MGRHRCHPGLQLHGEGQGPGRERPTEGVEDGEDKRGGGPADDFNKLSFFNMLQFAGFGPKLGIN